MKRKLTSVLSAAAVAGMVVAGAQTARAETTLSLVYPFPDFLIYTKLCKELVDKINAAGKGVVQIDVKPFNSIKMFQQPEAVSKGSVDLVCTPSAFYARAIPENEAISTSNSTPEKVRANGGMAMLAELHETMFNAKYLGWTDAGGRFRIYLKDAPKWTSDGLPDFNGVKLRDNPIYGAFFRALNATTHAMSSNEVYSALEKGVVNASAWATIGLMQLKWDQFLRHAVTPEFYQTDIGWMMNLDAWKGLDAKAQSIIEGEVIKHETYARETLEQMASEETAALKAGGMVFHEAPNPDAYLKLAVDSAYERMTGRIKEAGRSTDHIAKLRDLWQD